MQEVTGHNETSMIALHGPIRHGKSTMAAILQDIEPNSLYYESSTIISEVLYRSHQELREPFSTDRYAFTNQLLSKLPPILKDVVHVDVDPEILLFGPEEATANPIMYEKLLEHAARLQARPKLIEEQINSANKDFYRAGLQGIGGYLVSKVSATIWYDEIIRRSRLDKTDKTKLIIIGGPRYPSDAAVVKNAGGYIAEIIRPGVLKPDINDPTEAARRLIQSDTKIINNGDISNDLYAIGKVLYTDLVFGSLRQIYIADSIESNHIA